MAQWLAERQKDRERDWERVEEKENHHDPELEELDSGAVGKRASYNVGRREEDPIGGVGVFAEDNTDLKGV